MAVDRTIMTIGYEGRTVGDLVATLQSAGVRQVVDVRALPLSRRKGFSKTPLREALAANGIEYLHIRAAGNPFRHEENAKTILAKYRRHLKTTPEVVFEVETAALSSLSALLCMERAACDCHRSVISDALAERGLSVRHL